MMCNNWIIVERATGKPCLETYSQANANRVNTTQFEILTALKWLQRYNALVKVAGGVEPSPEAFKSAVGT